MKKLLLLFSCCLIFCACNNKTEEYVINNMTMYPNLRIDDIITIDKTAQDYTYGDVVCCWFDGNDIYPFEEPVRFIMRIVAVPGDSIAIYGMDCIINGKRSPCRYKRDLEEEFMGEKISLREYEETMPNGKKVRIYKMPAGGYYDDLPELLLPEDKYFVMGDFRDNTPDSRFIGYVDRSKIIGRMTEKRKMGKIYRFFYNAYLKTQQEQN